MLPRAVKLILSITITVGLGALSGLFTAEAISGWYASLEKPSFNPPNWVFGPVWTLLYLLMGISLYLVWKQPASSRRNTAITLFGIQYLLNMLWSFIFFQLHQVGWAFADILLLWLMIIATIIVFRPFSPAASWLLVPYIAWVSFAMLLNGAIWLLNS